MVHHATESVSSADISKYFSGEALYGDDFPLAEIAQWFEDEKEGYANLTAISTTPSRYYYHEVNKLYGYKYLAPENYHHVLGLGSAWGLEFLPIIDRIENLYILEPSDRLISRQIGNLSPVYSKPAVSGEIAFPDSYFDLIVCFDVLHHIPNVSQIIGEMVRCMKPGGHLLLKEPIISMGDWRRPRPGLTTRERGIPLCYFRKKIIELDMKILKESLLFTMTSFLTRKTANILRKPIYSYKSYLLADQWLSRVFRNNISYHPTTKWQRIAPTEVFYVLEKGIENSSG